jgi:hypothetical protein
MTSRTPALALAALVVLVLGACSAADGAGTASSDAGGMIEMAVSETCDDVSDSQCVSVNGTSVVAPAEFQEAGVEEASVAESDQSVVEVTFTDDGAEVLHALTEEAAGTGDLARLVVIRVGGELQAAVMVMEALTGNQVQIGLAPEADAQELVDLIQAG